MGGLVAVGVAAKGADSIGWGTLLFAAAGWVCSPLCGMLMSFLTYYLIRWLILERPDAEARSRQHQKWFLALAIAIAALFILLKGPKSMRIKPAWLAAVVAAGIGLAVALASVVIKSCWTGATQAPVTPVKDNAANPVSVLTAGEKDRRERDDVNSPNSTTAMYNADDVEQAEPEADEADEGDEEGDDTAPRAEVPFIPLLIVSALSVAFAHGGNDVANAVGPLAVIVEVYNGKDVTGTPEIHYWELSLGSAGFVIGIMLLGSRTIKTVGQGLCKNLNPAKAFAVQTGAAIAVLGSSALGLPVSTSHCLVGAVVGVSLASKLRGSKDDLDLSVLKRIVMGWVVTIPLAMMVAVLVFLPLRAVFGVGG